MSQSYVKLHQTTIPLEVRNILNRNDPDGYYEIVVGYRSPDYPILEWWVERDGERQSGLYSFSK